MVVQLDLFVGVVFIAFSFGLVDVTIIVSEIDVCCSVVRTMTGDVMT